MARDYGNYSKDALIAHIYELEKQLKNNKYGLYWDKSIEPEKVVTQCKTNIPILERQQELCIFDSEEADANILIEGDNFHALSTLNMMCGNEGLVDIIYIDPPYNTENEDFIYNDKFVEKEDGYRHSKWLDFMSKRLQLARNLLKKDGLVLISIDDYEFAQLKLLCDLVFGDKRFINMFVWQRNSSGKTEKDKFTVNTEYVLLYAKTDDYILNSAYKPLAESSRKMYNKDDKDGRGRYATVSLQKPKNPGPKTTYDYVDNSGKIWKCPPKGWRMTEDKIKALENDGRLIFSGKSLRVKDYWNERENEGKRIDTLWNDLSENNVGSKELEIVMGRKNTFDNPKPTGLIKRCLQIGGKDGIVLDFFAGSGTTGQAVLELNKEDGGHRRFIICTNNEGNICTNITYPRIKTVITGKRQDGSHYSDGIPSNLMYYKTDFIKDSNNTDQAKYSLVEKVDELICIMEETFVNKERTEQYSHYQSFDGSKNTFIYSDYYSEEPFDSFIALIQKTDGEKTVYMFSTDNTIDEKLFDGIKDVNLKPIPSKIYEIYKEIVEDIKRGEQ